MYMYFWAPSYKDVRLIQINRKSSNQSQVLQSIASLQSPISMYIHVVAIDINSL